MALVAFALVAATAATALASSGVNGKPTALTRVIVRATPGAEPRVESITRLLGGHVQRRLPIVDRFSATVPQSSVATLRHIPGVLSVTPNAGLRPAGADYEPAGDSNSMAATPPPPAHARGGPQAPPAAASTSR